MSGFEVVGVLFAVFPLLISAGEHYKDGFEPLVKWYRFRDDFIQFIDAVATQKLLFDQTLERFLISADVPDEELQQFLNNPSYEGWQRKDLVDLLKARLGPGYDVYMSTIKRMSALLLELQAMLLVKTVKNGKEEWEVEWARDGANRWNYQMKRICLSFSKKGTVVIEELERLNKKLAVLLESKDKLDGLRATRKNTSWANIFAGIRCHANTLFEVLRNGWNCECQAEHSTALRLQKRKTGGWSSSFHVYFSVPSSTPKTQRWRKEIIVSVKKQVEELKELLNSSLAAEKDEYLTKLRRDFETQVTITPRPDLTSSVSDSSSTSARSSFRDLFKPEGGKFKNSSNSSTTELVVEDKTARNWLTNRPSRLKKSVRMDIPAEIPLDTRITCAVVQPVVQDIHVQPEPTSPITDLCSTIFSCPSNASCLGYLIDSQNQRHELQFVPESYLDDEKSTSLEELLNSNEAFKFSRQQRYKVASILASSLLQLQTTPWLQSQLDKKNIFFYRDGQDILFDRPYIRHSFYSSKKATPKEETTSPPLPARFAARSSLNNLGTLLLELCFGKPVEKCELRKYHLGADGQAHERTNWCTTRDWAELVGEEDPRLEHVINCCVFDVLSLQQKPDWQSEVFVQAVYVSIVEPLEKLIEKWQPA